MSPLSEIGNQKPQVVWDQLLLLVDQAFEYQPEEAQRLLDKYQPPYKDQESLLGVLQNLSPQVGVANFQYLNQKIDLQQVMKAKPLAVLEEVLRMLTLSDKWQREVST